MSDSKCERCGGAGSFTVQAEPPEENQWQPTHEDECPACHGTGTVQVARQERVRAVRRDLFCLDVDKLTDAQLAFVREALNMVRHAIGEDYFLPDDHNCHDY